MTISKKEFRKLQKSIGLINNKIEKEATYEGGDISDPDFMAGMVEIKKALLRKKGLTLDDYDGLKEDYKDKEEPEEIEVKLV